MGLLTVDAVERRALEPSLIALDIADGQDALTLFFHPEGRAYTIFRGTRLVRYSPSARMIVRWWNEMCSH